MGINNPIPRSLKSESKYVNSILSIIISKIKLLTFLPPPNCLEKQQKSYHRSSNPIK